LSLLLGTVALGVVAVDGSAYCFAYDLSVVVCFGVYYFFSVSG
jgi:hypothetical protein